MDDFNNPLEWIESRPWDGIKRIDSLIATVKSFPSCIDEQKSAINLWLNNSVSILIGFQIKNIALCFYGYSKARCDMQEWMNHLV